MIINLLILRIITLSFLFPVTSQPLTFGLTLLITTLISARICALISSSWYAYILFLIFIGGLLVIFAYVAALAPNAFFKPILHKPILLLLPTIYLISSWLFLPYALPIISSISSLPLHLTNSASVIFFPSFLPALIFITFILLVTLIAVAKICAFNIAPLRPHK